MYVLRVANYTQAFLVLTRKFANSTFTSLSCTEHAEKCESQLPNNQTGQLQ